MAARGSSITVSYTAWDTSANAGKTGDAGNHTLKWIKDGTAATATNAPTEVDATNAPGEYKLVLTAAECNCDFGTLAGKSSTANISIMAKSYSFDALPIIRGGTAQAGAGSTVTLDASASATDNFYRGATVQLVGGTGVGQERLIVSYVGSTKVATIAPAWITNPDVTSVFIVGPWSGVDLEMVANTTQTARDLGLALPAAAAGASGGLHINGSNAGTTTLAALTITGTLTISDGIVVTRSSANQNAVSFTGNGTGHGLLSTSGSGATGDGIRAVAASAGGVDIRGNLTGNIVGTVSTVTNVTTVNGLAAGVITATSIATDAITAAKIAADAIGASELAADAVTEIVTAVLTTVMTESYAADGAAPTLAQILFAIQQFQQEKNISGTAVTVKKLDGSTTAFGLTLDSGTAPTTITRTS